jgi:hypothetical protein
MIRLKQKKAEEERKAAEIEADAANKVDVASNVTNLNDNTITTNFGNDQQNTKIENSVTNDSSNIDKDDEGDSGLKLFGVGGKSARSADGVRKNGKKKTPGEIRIQKGKKFHINCK